MRTDTRHGQTPDTDRHPTRTPPGYVASPETFATRSVCNNQ